MYSDRRFLVQISGTATVLSPDDPEIVELLESGKLKSITGHGVLKEPGGCFLKIKPARKIHTYGIGIPALDTSPRRGTRRPDSSSRLSAIN